MDCSNMDRYGYNTENLAGGGDRGKRVIFLVLRSTKKRMCKSKVLVRFFHVIFKQFVLYNS